MTKVNLTTSDLEEEEAAFKAILKNLCLDLNVLMPASVVSFDGDTVVVQPMIKSIYTTGETESRPKLKMKVYKYGGSGFYQWFNLKKGDLGWVKFCDRDISNFIETLQESAPETRRYHSLEDCVFYPDNMSAVNKSKADFAISSDDGTVKVEFTPTEIKITNAEKSLTLLKNSFNIIADTTVTGNLTNTGILTAGNGVSGSFVSADNKTITVVNGIVTGIG